MSPGLDFGVADALALRYVSGHAWNADGSRLGYLRFDGGETRLAVRPVGEVRETALDPGTADRDPVMTDCGDVSAFDWRPDHAAEAAVVADGALLLFDADAGEATIVAEAEAAHGSPAWDPDGRRLAYVRDGTLWLHDLDGGSLRAANAGGDDVAEMFGPTPVEWSPDGRHLATLTATGDGLGLAVFDAAGDGVDSAWAWSPGDDDRAFGGFEWVDDGHLVCAVDSTDGHARTYRSVRVDGDGEEDRGDGVAILSETDDATLAGTVLAGNGDGLLAVLSPRTGYHHVYVVDVDRRREVVGTADGGDGADGDRRRSEGDGPGFDGDGVVQVTGGPFEARGDAVDAPAWSDDGSLLAYVTNERDPGERHLHVASVAADGSIDETEAYDDVPGNALYPTWAGDGERVAVVRAGRTTPADVHVVDRRHGAMARYSRAHPEPSAFEAFPDPEPVAFEGEGGVTVRGYLYEPPESLSDGEDGTDEERPAVVWCHGGPVRQMRRGFHHMRSYAFFHAFNHVLLSRGYVVIELNYRGGIGYGRAFEHGIHHAIGVDDVADCADAAAFLRDRDGVGDRVGLWGLSYGGFLANAVATKTDAYDCAVNFAGIWDWRDWVTYAETVFDFTHAGLGARFGGPPESTDEAVADRYEQASPCESAEGMETPLFALHGTDDPNVHFEQMDMLVSDLVDLGAEFEMAYYPDEDHMFRDASTWADALDRVLPFLDAHLRGK